ncbi:thioredoxin fold domain-containing protein [Vibrio sp. SCSIO 43136]|uniref:thioredoxin fold domain-containing protein n=1 Tax=Vibrio sp. SCSIO 43136 TaxID=2819101 RepID=UPI002074DD89|nr:thioredoxin fold domain-containing protein [Vibrio sp. SCSIO 43136]USD65742.1 thioredoxin fold domain-containing protein [Vibrio sp. SCSIO 43136]
MRLFRQLAILGSSLLLSATTLAAQTANVAEIEARFAKIGISVTEVSDSEVEGLVEVTTNQGLFFVTPSGDHFIHGKMFSLNKDGEYRDVMAKKSVDKIAKFESSWIEYKAENEKYAITVFTDTDCGYCLKLHKRMKAYNDLGITVRYLAYPRAGVQSKTGLAMSSIWCSADPKAAMDTVKLNRTLPEGTSPVSECSDTIAKQFLLGKNLGVTGTPAIIAPNGSLIGGFVEPNELIAHLDAISASKS